MKMNNILLVWPALVQLCFTPNAALAQGSVATREWFDPVSALDGGLTVFIVLTVFLIAYVALKPELASVRGGKILIATIFVVMPLLALTGGISQHLHKSKTTVFCLSCHVMEDYGSTLWLEDTDYLAAGHFQNNRIDREHACYTCHTTYTMFGDFQAKMSGFKHLLVNYLGDVPEDLGLYRPYENRECLHCHEGGRQYLDTHIDFVNELTGETSCLECHDLVHPVERANELPKWERADS
jgi:hypothetical protein